VAEAQDRRCEHCSVLLVPEIRTFDAPWLEGGELLHPIYGECQCEGAMQAQAAAERRKRAAMAEEQQRTWQRAMERAGLIGWLAEARFENFQQREEWPALADMAQRVQRFVGLALVEQLGDRPWLILHGNYGTGKTHLAAAAVRSALEGGWRRVFFRPWTQYLKRLQASWDRRDGEERTSDIIEELQQGRLVAIDDLDKREPGRSGWAREELYTALNYRYNAQLPILLTFNYSPGEADPEAPGRMRLERYLGKAILDRIIGAAFDVIAFEGPSYRSGVRARA